MLGVVFECLGVCVVVSVVGVVGVMWYGEETVF